MLITIGRPSCVGIVETCEGNSSATQTSQSQNTTRVAKGDRATSRAQGNARQPGGVQRKQSHSSICKRAPRYRQCYHQSYCYRFHFRDVSAHIASTGNVRKLIPARSTTNFQRMTSRIALPLTSMQWDRCQHMTCLNSPGLSAKMPTTGPRTCAPAFDTDSEER